MTRSCSWPHAASAPPPRVSRRFPFKPCPSTLALKPRNHAPSGHRNGTSRARFKRNQVPGRRPAFHAPPPRQKNVRLLDSLLTAIGRPTAAEFRHESWFADDAYRVLREHGGALVVTDEEKWPRAPLVDLSAIAYFRLRRGYGGASLRSWIAEVRAALAAHDQVHVYFRHQPESPALAQRLLRLAAREPAPR